MCLVQIRTLQYHIAGNQLMVFFSIHNSNGFSLKNTLKCTSVFNIYYLTQMPVDQSFVYDPYFANKETDSDNLRNCSKSQISSVQLLSCVRLFVTQRTTARQAPLSITNSWSLLKFMSIKSVMPSNHLILCRPLLFLPSNFPSIRVFSNESVLCIRWPYYWSFSFNISPSNEYSELISFRIDWLDFLAVQRTLKSIIQHHSSKASILQRSAFFIL